ncbi:putative fimbrial-like protein ElfG precursor [compost metagenome]
MKRAVVGQVVLPMTEVASLWACVPDDGHCLPGGAPVYRYSLAGTLTMPASCSINAGETITVDFGDMSTEDFAAAGQTALNAVRPIRVPIQCNGGVQNAASLELSFAATPATQNERVITTSNPDLGIVLGASGQLSNASNWIAPNTGTVPLQLDGTGAAEVMLYAAPVRVGNQPQAGAFTSVATLKISIP